MTYQQRMFTYATNGNLALKPRQTQGFELIEGGRSHAASPAPQSFAMRLPLQAALYEGVPTREQGEATHFQTVACCVVIAATFVLILALSFLFDARASSKRAQVFDAAATAVVTVHSGDTLWEIAEAHPVDGCSVQDVISYIKEENALTTATIQAGQQLIVPATNTR